MGPADQVQVVGTEELLHNVLAEGEGDATVVLAPALDALLRVAPQQVANETRVRDVGRADDLADLLHRAQLRGEPAVHAQDLFLNDLCVCVCVCEWVSEGRCLNSSGPYRPDRHAVEGVGELLPQLDGVPPLALVVEAVDSVYRGALVVAAQQEEVLVVLDLEGEEQALRVVFACVSTSASTCAKSRQAGRQAHTMVSRDSLPLST